MKHDACCDLEPSDALAKRDYVLFISGTMNPPHVGHVRLGFSAADRLRAHGHKVSAICYAPVHDNYLCNKVIAKRSTGSTLSVTDKIAFPMSERCTLLRTLIDNEASADVKLCHVLDYEHSSGDASLLTSSPGYWAPKLPGGYLMTVPTSTVIAHFASHSPLMRSGTRLGVVFGVDNMANMATWNHPERLFAQADLILLARATPRVAMARDPSELLSALKHLQIDVAVPVVYGDEEVLGSAIGSFVNRIATGDGALFLLPALEGQDEGLSSTRIREAVGAQLTADIGDEQRAEPDLAGTSTMPAEAILAQHGYPASSLAHLIRVSTNGEQTVHEMIASGKARREWVVG